MKLEGARVLLTGATGRLGGCIARSLGERGAMLLLSGRDEVRLEELLRVQHKEGHAADAVPVDLTHSAERAYLAQLARSWKGGVNVVIHAAGVARVAGFEQQSESELARAVMLNLTVPMLLTRSLIPALREQIEACVVTLGAIPRQIDPVLGAAHGATQAALCSWSERLRFEYAPAGVRFAHVEVPRTPPRWNDVGPRVRENTLESCGRVVEQLCEALELDRDESSLGWPDRWFERVHSLLPRLGEHALPQRLQSIRRFAARKPPQLR